MGATGCAPPFPHKARFWVSPRDAHRTGVAACGVRAAPVKVEPWGRRQRMTAPRVAASARVRAWPQVFLPLAHVRAARASQAGAMGLLTILKKIKQKEKEIRLLIL